MARYIDADKFKSQLERASEKMHLIGGVKGVGIGAVIEALDRQPTADVAPKSEVILDTLYDFQSRLRNTFCSMCDYNDYGRVCLLEIDRSIEYLFNSFVAELKKKYTGEQI